MLLKPYTLKEKAALDHTMKYMSMGTGYMAEQSTKPQTLGYCLADSPVGLLAWIYEKLVRWTDEYAWDDDEGRELSSICSLRLKEFSSPHMGVYLLVLPCRSRRVVADLF
jgi:hypothetical protein